MRQNATLPDCAPINREKEENTGSVEGEGKSEPKNTPPTFSEEERSISKRYEVLRKD